MSKIYTIDTNGKYTDIIVFHSFLEAFENLYKSVCHKFSYNIPLFGDDYFINKVKEVFIQDNSNTYFSSTCINIAQDLYGQPPEYLKKINDSMKDRFSQLKEVFNKGVNKEDIYFEFDNISFSSVDANIDKITMAKLPDQEMNPMDPEHIAMMEKELLEEELNEVNPDNTSIYANMSYDELDYNECSEIKPLCSISPKAKKYAWK